MKKFLTFAVIAMLFTACNKSNSGNGDDDVTTPPTPSTGEVENSFIAISLASDGMTRNEVFDDGLAAERNVKSIYVFFFKNGEAFIGASGNTTNNYQSIEVNSSNQDPANDNISDINKSVLVIKNYKGELPNQMVAVLNWTPTAATYTLEALKDALVNHINRIDGTDYFVMSNSVYKDITGDVYATPLAVTDFKKSADEATASPVKVYVERVAAKVRVNTPDVTDHTFELLEKNGGKMEIDGQQIYAKITGWDLYNDYTQSHLLKSIEGCPAHNDEFEGFYWNSASNHRSYWANNADVTIDATTNTLDLENLTYETHRYCGENVKGFDSNNSTEDQIAARTKVVLTAQLQDNAGNPIEIAKWFGSEYIGKTTLLTAVKNTIANTYYSSTDGVKYSSIEASDLMTVAGDGTDVNVYQVYFQISTAVNKTWYKLNGDKFESITTEALNADLKANIDPALLYTNGHTYYFTDIKHLGAAYGVVRNHVYDVNIKSITGLGTPVVDENYEITVPVVPEEDKETFVAAEINILSWRVISNDVNL